MGFHHVAIATRDVKANHAFYTEAMGFRLAKVVAGATPTGGWAKHLFYDTGNGELIAFWDLHDAKIPSDFDPRIAEGLGLPDWTNHIAFHADDLAAIERVRERWLAHGCDVAQVDHGWCTSVYTKDPNGILVEFCTTTQAFTPADFAEAQRLLESSTPELEEPKSVQFFRAPARS